ncbi:MAG: molybdenum cofactor guanylyltransferase, partial [Chloroflexota bacterium]
RAAPTGAAVPIRLVADPEPYGGPLVGLLAGLEAASEPLVLVAGGDMPSMNPAVLALLVETLRADPNHTAAVLTSRGRVVPLPAALRTGAASDMARRLVGDGERRLRTLVERLRPIVLDEAEWRPLDPEGTTLRDVDRPEDLPGA